MTKTAVPYSSATSGKAAREEITKILKQFGCSEIGFLDNYDRHSVRLYFKHHGRHVDLEASATGWAAMYLRHEPWNRARRTPKAEYEAKVLEQGMVAINSILRDWVKGQVTAIECGILSFTAVFMAHMIAPNGQPILEYLTSTDMLPKPEKD